MELQLAEGKLSTTTSSITQVACPGMHGHQYTPSSIRGVGSELQVGQTLEPIRL